MAQAKHASEVRMGTPREVEPEITDGESEATAPAAAEPDWADMDTAPQDGSAVLLTDGESEATGCWRRTRKYDPTSMSWRPIGYWAIHNGGGQPVRFDPLGWKPE